MRVMWQLCWMLGQESTLFLQTEWMSQTAARTSLPWAASLSPITMSSLLAVITAGRGSALGWVYMDRLPNFRIHTYMHCIFTGYSCILEVSRCKHAVSPRVLITILTALHRTVLKKHEWRSTSNTWLLLRTCSLGLRQWMKQEQLTDAPA